MSEPAGNVSERMRSEWNQRAKEDAHFYVAFGARDQDEAGFAATVADVLPCIEEELKRFPREGATASRRALEIGCGPGRLMKPLSRRFAEIHGVDVSDEMIRLARERLRDIPHAHVHATDGASLGQFADEYFDLVYSYAVFQHIPSREVVLQYMRETCRVLRPGGVFRGQFNGLPHSSIPDTWSGVTFSAEDIRAFTRENGLQLLALEGVQTQYMWTTWRKFTPRLALPASSPAPSIKGITNAHSYEPVAPKRERHAAISIWMTNLPEECDLNDLEVLVEGAPADPYYVGWPIAEGVRQVNAWLPAEIRTGLLPVEVRMHGRRVGTPGTVRIIPAGPLIPRIVSVTDGFNLVEKNISSSGVLKIQIEEVSSPESLSVTISGRPVAWLEIKCTDPRAPRFEVNLGLPEALAPGRHLLQVRTGRWQLPAEIDFQPANSLSQKT
jgi:ubiquinone/menaquinone biosynthesis C-methylase UbiE